VKASLFMRLSYSSMALVYICLADNMELAFSMNYVD